MQIIETAALYSEDESERETLIREILESFQQLSLESRLRYLSQLREMLESEKAAD